MLNLKSVLTNQKVTKSKEVINTPKKCFVLYWCYIGVEMCVIFIWVFI